MLGGELVFFMSLRKLFNFRNVRLRWSKKWFIDVVCVWVSIFRSLIEKYLRKSCRKMIFFLIRLEIKFRGGIF